MAARLNKDTADASGIDEYPKARRENGTFILPWSGRLPAALSALKWFMTSPNNSNVPGNTLSKLYCYDAQVNFFFSLRYIEQFHQAVL